MTSALQAGLEKARAPGPAEGGNLPTGGGSVDMPWLHNQPRSSQRRVAGHFIRSRRHPGHARWRCRRTTHFAACAKTLRVTLAAIPLQLPQSLWGSGASNPLNHARPNFKRKTTMTQLPTGTVTPASIVEAMKAVAGGPPRARASFAKGRCVHGTYAASDRAEEITKSRSFTRPSRVLARFSLGGDREVANTDRVLRGFSFRLGGDQHRSDLLMQSAPVHFARTLDQMLAFPKARVSGPDGKPDMEEIRAFSAANPETLRQANYIAAPPLDLGFAGTTYWGVHCFPATNLKGETRFIKFKVVPVGADVAPTQKADVKSADFLLHDLENRITAGDVRFSVTALLDRPGDPTMDVTSRWSDEDSREAVRLGTIVITGVEAEDACDAAVFNPANLADGIGHPPDEIFAARRAAYAIAQATRR
jgi:catalase